MSFAYASWMIPPAAYVMLNSQMDQIVKWIIPYAGYALLNSQMVLRMLDSAVCSCCCLFASCSCLANPTALRMLFTYH